jgi:hypothetical protein
MTALSWRGRFAPPLPVISGPAGSAATEIYQSAHGLVESFYERAEARKADKRFTDDHKRQETKADAVKSVRRLLPQRDRFEPIREAARQHRANARPVKPRGRDDLVGQLREHEIRSFVRSLPDSERMAFLNRALIERNEDIVSAFVNAPAAAMLGVSDAGLASLMVSATKEFKPGEVASAEQVEEALSALDRKFTNAVDLIAEAAGMSPGELVRAAEALDRAERENKEAA